MIAKGYFTKRELALIIGLDLMDITLNEIAEDLGRSELDVTTALTRAKTLIHDPIVAGVLKARGLPATNNSKPIRRMPAEPMPLPIRRPQFLAAPASVTAALMGDPAPGRSALDQVQQERVDGCVRIRTS